MSWLLDSGATNHMTGSKDLVVEVHPIPSMPTHVQFGDASTSKVLGLGKVVISQDLTIEKVMLVESLAYNLLSVHRLALMGFATFFDLDTVALLWSKTLKVAFVAKDRACSACIEGKLHETAHRPSTIIYSKRPLELLHMDLFGPPSFDSLGGRKY